MITPLKKTKPLLRFFSLEWTNLYISVGFAQVGYEIYGL